jgi:hypothetical protein
MYILSLLKDRMSELVTVDKVSSWSTIAAAKLPRSMVLELVDTSRQNRMNDFQPLGHSAALP